jgi:hypothetical protein
MLMGGTTLLTMFSMQIGLPLSCSSDDRTLPRPVDIGLPEVEKLFDMLDNHAWTYYAGRG